jgi:hypothetical protein
MRLVPGRSSATLDDRNSSARMHPLPDMTLSKRISSSLLGHVALFEVILSAPAFAYGLASNYSDGLLTPAFTIEMAVELAAIGAAVGFAVWHCITLPLIRRQKK